MSDAAPVHVRTERDAVVVTITLASSRLRAGHAQDAIVTVTNAGQGAVFWQGGGCDLLGNIALVGPVLAPPVLPDPPAGADPDAVAGLIRWAALAGGTREHTPFVPPDLPPGIAFGCDASLRINELGAGQQEHVQARWRGTTADGLPAPAGRYAARVAFPFLVRQAAPPFDGDPLEDQRPIEVAAGFDVEGAAWTGLRADEAVDVALADPRISRWIASGLRRTDLGGASIRLVDGRWRLEVQLVRGESDPPVLTTADVDPATGIVTAVSLPGG